MDGMALQRIPQEGVLGGVCAGVAEEVGASVTTVRAVFALTGLVGGIGVVVYGLLLLLTPARESERQSPRSRRATWLLLALALLGAGLLTLLVGVPRTGALVLAGIGAGLVWWRPEPTDDQPSRAPLRVGVGIGLLALAAVLLIAYRVGLSSLASTLFVAGAVLVGAMLVASPFIVRLVRERDRERAEQVAVRQRADIAAHLHDSVLQTLALIQRDHADPDQVLRLARAEERGLRAWLYEHPAAPGEALGLAEQLQDAAAAVEQSEAAVIEVVTVGDLESTGPRTDAVVAAAREAMLNAVRHAGDPQPVQVFARISPEEVSVFVRDRGVGFDPDALPHDRGGVRESILGRITRTGGSASIRSSPGAGTEVQIRMPL